MLNKNVFLIGRTGAGKSTLGSMLIRGTLDKTDNVFDISDSANGVTVDCDVRSNNKWTVYDTIGLGEPASGSVPNEEAKRRIVSFLKKIKTSVDYICILKKKGRLDQLDLFIYDIVKEIFKGAESNIVLIITHADQKWLHENKYEIKEIYNNIPALAVDFPAINNNERLEIIYKEIRETSLQVLEEWLNDLDFNKATPDICHYSDHQLESLATKVLRMLKQILPIIADIASIAATVAPLCSIQ